MPNTGDLHSLSHAATPRAPASPRPHPVTLSPSHLVILLLPLLLAGCFSEHSFPMNPKREMHFTKAELSPDSERLSARDWAARAVILAAPLLPTDADPPLTTDDLSQNGQPINVFQHFDVNPNTVDNLFDNLDGIEQTAQIVSPDRKLDAKGDLIRPVWKNFTDVDVPVAPGVTLYGRLSDPLPEAPNTKHQAPNTKHETPNQTAADGGTYIIITHGLFGSIDGDDMQNQVAALRSAGFRVLAVEMRGHGETQCRHPELTLSFGIHESGDLLAAANWLKSQYHAKRVGLVSFSLGGYEALITAWLDGAEPVTRFQNLPFLADLPRPRPEPAFNAGMLIVSSPIDVVGIADRFNTRFSLFDAPIKATFENHIAHRIASYHEPATFSMWGLAESEFYRAGWGTKYGSFAALKPDLVRFLDLKAGDWQEGVRRMENVRIPLLMINTANDPLATAQGVADLFGRVKNPNIGVILLGEGGHMALSAYATDYYYTLMLNFFNPKTGPTAQNPLPLAKAP